MPKYKCSVCGKMLSRSNKLSEHVRSHTGEKPFNCVVCGKWFSRSYDLTKHKELHSGSYRYRCAFKEDGVQLGCGKGFHKRGDLNRHLQRDNARLCWQGSRPNNESTLAEPAAAEILSNMRDAHSPKLNNEFEVHMHLPVDKNYVTDLDVETLKRAEAFHNSIETERGPRMPSTESDDHAFEPSMSSMELRARSSTVLEGNGEPRTTSSSSCTACRSRRLRCTGQLPCTDCVRGSLECVFPRPDLVQESSGRPPDEDMFARLRRLDGVVNNIATHSVEPQPPSGSSHFETSFEPELLARLRRLESLVQSLGVQLDECEPEGTQSDKTPAVRPTSPSMSYTSAGNSDTTTISVGDFHDDISPQESLLQLNQTAMIDTKSSKPATAVPPNSDQHDELAIATSQETSIDTGRSRIIPSSARPLSNQNIAGLADADSRFSFLSAPNGLTYVFDW